MPITLPTLSFTLSPLPAQRSPPFPLSRQCQLAPFLLLSPLFCLSPIFLSLHSLPSLSPFIVPLSLSPISGLSPPSSLSPLPALSPPSSCSPLLGLSPPSSLSRLPVLYPPSLPLSTPCSTSPPCPIPPLYPASLPCPLSSICPITPPCLSPTLCLVLSPVSILSYPHPLPCPISPLCLFYSHSLPCPIPSLCPVLFPLSFPCPIPPLCLRGGTTSAESTPPPHRHDTRYQAACRRAREEQERLERERQELRHGLWALGLPSSPPIRPPSPPAFGPTFSPPDARPAVWFSPPPQSPPVVRHYCSRPCPPSARPSSLVTDLHTALLCTSLRRSPPPVSVLPSPPLSSLPVSPTLISDYFCAVCPVVYRVLTTGVTDPRFSPSSVSALTATVADFAVASRLEYSSRVVLAPPTRPLSVGGEFSLGCDFLEDGHSELECLAAASPTLCAMLLSPDGDPDALDIPNPRTYREAVLGQWASQWKAAMDPELASWRSTGTYVDAVPPPWANVVDGMWLFKVKRPPGSPPVFKARYVARGFSQREGVDFFQTFAPTPKMTTLRVLLYVAAQRDYELHSLDFSTTFLQGWLHEEIWLRRPPGFTGTFPTGTLVRLSSADPSRFIRGSSTPFFILVYIVDLVFATPDRAALAEVKDRAACTITLTQSHMVQQVLQRFELQFSTTQPTPLAVDHRLTGPFLDEPFEPSGPYPQLVGCLMYLMTCTRPDLAYPLSVLSHFVWLGRHRPVHWMAAMRLAKYLATTSGMGLVLGGTRPVELTGLCDFSYADDVETQRSTQGYCFSLGAGVVSWRSTQFLLVALSSAEVEIYAGAMAAQELRWVKHIDVRHFLLRELQQHGQVRLDFVTSEANTADLFTKALAPGDHHRFYV
ncbi:unnamed protein product [Closterium sp. NIES-53]